MNRGGQSVHGGHKDDGGTYGKLGGDDLTRGEQVQGSVEPFVRRVSRFD